MWKNQFTPGAQDALCLAQAAAEELGHSYVGSEHLLLGLLREEGAAGRCLAAQQVTADRVRREIVRVVGSGLPGLAPAQGLTPRARRVIENAAGASGGGRIGTEHLLLGLLREGGAMGTQVLRSSGADLRQLQAALGQQAGLSPCLRRENSGRAAPSREELPRSKLLEQFTRSLTALAREGRLDPVVGREGEIGRAVRILYVRAGGREGVFTMRHAQAVLALCAGGDPSAQADLPGGITASRRYEKLVLGRERTRTPLPCVRLEPGMPVQWGEWTLCLAPERVTDWPMAAFLSPEGTQDGLFVRPRAAGDVIRLPGGHRLLKKWMIDRKIPQKDRDRTPVLCDNKKIRALFWDRVYTAEKEEEQRAVAVAARRDRE